MPRSATLGRLIVPLALFPLACTELPEIAPGTCGNAVVDAQEDCDTFVTRPGGVCRAPGTAGECRWDCTSGADACPEGWGCGADGLCRTASGAFQPTGKTIFGSPVLSADLDGDTRADLMTQLGLQADFTFFGEDAAVQSTVSLPVGAGDVPAVGDLTDDGRSDVAVRVGFVGIGTLLATEDRALEPVLQPSIQLPLIGKGEHMVIAEARAFLPGREVFDFGFEGTRVNVIDPEVMMGQDTLFELARDASAVAGVGVGDLDEASPCEELVVAYLPMDAQDSLAQRVFVHPTCIAVDEYAFGAVPSEIALPTAHVVLDRPFVADANGDGWLDVLITATTAGGGTALDVAFGQGDGTFHSIAAELPAAAPDNAAGTVLEDPTGGVGAPLAIGDLNLDGRADGVLAEVILISQSVPGEPYVAVPTSVTGWTEAIIGDFNANGLPDILAARPGAPGLDFYNGVGDGTFNTFTISTTGHPSSFVGGDFDGDLVDDVACVIRDPAGVAQDEFAVLFGRSVGPPEAPVTLGRLPFIHQLAAGKSLMTWVLLGFVPSDDATSDLLILADADPAAPQPSSTLSIVLGTSTRLLQSPLLLFKNEGDNDGPDYPVRTTFGRFSEGSVGDVCAYGIDSLGLVSTDPQKAEGRFWVFTSTGDGKLSPPRPSQLVDEPAFKALVLPNGIYFPQVITAAGDLDGGGDGAIEEIVTTAVAPKLDGTYNSAVAVLRAEGDTISAEVERTEESFGTVLLLGDLDGDGLPEAVALQSAFVPPFFGIDGTFEKGPDGGVGSVVVYWNEGGTLALDAPTAIEPAEGVFGLALVNVDSDPVRELVTSGPEGISVFELAAGSHTFEQTSTMQTPFGGGPMVAGDFNGDGVEDLAMADFGGNSMVYLGVPVRP